MRFRIRRNLTHNDEPRELVIEADGIRVEHNTQKGEPVLVLWKHARAESGYQGRVDVAAFAGRHWGSVIPVPPEEDAK